jgi:hypothetical protein
MFFVSDGMVFAFQSPGPRRQLLIQKRRKIFSQKRRQLLVQKRRRLPIQKRRKLLIKRGASCVASETLKFTDALPDAYL